MNDNKFFYIVTIYGCNSTSGDMWMPESKLFTSFEKAYAYFISKSPDLNDEDNEAEQYVNSNYNRDDNNKEYVVIEYRKQLGGYVDGAANRAKRPEGAIIARITM